jgi:hypothetical protein
MIRHVLTPRATDLFSDPVRWVGKHLAFYAVASVLAGLVFVAGAGVYSMVVPVPALPVLSPAQAPTEATPTATPPSSKEGPRDVFLISGLGAVPREEIEGSPILNDKGETIGYIRSVLSTQTKDPMLIVADKYDQKPLSSQIFLWSKNNSGRLVVRFNASETALFNKPATGVAPSFAVEPALHDRSLGVTGNANSGPVGAGITGNPNSGQVGANPSFKGRK